MSFTYNVLGNSEVYCEFTQPVLVLLSKLFKRKKISYFKEMAYVQRNVKAPSYYLKLVQGKVIFV